MQERGFHFGIWWPSCKEAYRTKEGQPKGWKSNNWFLVHFVPLKISSGERLLMIGVTLCKSTANLRAKGHKSSVIISGQRWVAWRSIVWAWWVRVPIILSMMPFWCLAPFPLKESDWLEASQEDLNCFEAWTPLLVWYSLIEMPWSTAICLQQCFATNISSALVERWKVTWILFRHGQYKNSCMVMTFGRLSLEYF